VCLYISACMYVCRAPILNSEITAGEQSALHSCSFLPGDTAPSTHWVRRGGPQSQSGHYGEKKEKSLTPAGSPMSSSPILGKFILTSDTVSTGVSQHTILASWAFLWKLHCSVYIASGVGLSALYCGHFWPIVPLFCV
jgi:hypothetical protein